MHMCVKYLGTPLIPWQVVSSAENIQDLSYLSQGLLVAILLNFMQFAKWRDLYLQYINYW